MPSFSRNGGSGMLGNIKSRLGFGGNDAEYDDYDDYEDYEEYDEYDDYDDAFDDYEEYDDYDDQDARDREMDRYGAVVERDASARRSRRSYTDAASSDFDERRRGNGYTPLVSIDDIRANTPRLSMDAPAGARSSTLTRHEFRSSDYMASGSLEKEFIPEGNGISSGDDGSRRSSGYDSLFSSTSSAARNDDSASTSSSAASYRSSRQVIVLAPKDYGEVEKVSRTLKAGDAVVLNLKTVPSALSKRVLDFSFGVASALDANVDCIADKVFALTLYAPLSDAERMRLRSQGVL